MNTVIVKVYSTNKLAKQLQVQTKKGQPTVIKADKNVNYEFLDQSVGRAPNHIITKRKGKDLHVSFEREGKEDDLIIQDFYASDNHALIGLAEDGKYYHYIPDTGEVANYVTQLAAGDVQGQALGGNDLVAPWWVGTTQQGGNAWLLGLAAIPIIAAAGSSDSKSDDVRAEAVNPPADDKKLLIKILNDNYTTEPNKPVTLKPLANDSHENGDVLTITSINGTAVTPNTDQRIDVPNGVVNVAKDGTITFTPNEGFSGEVTFPYTISDSKGVSATANETISVKAAEPAPIPNNNPIITKADTYTTEAKTPVKLNPLANASDPDGDRVTVSSINGTPIQPNTDQRIDVPNGVVSVTKDGTITFTPNDGFSGAVTFPYTISDGKGGSATANQTINVNSTGTEPTPSTNNPPVVKPVDTPSPRQTTQSPLTR